jgi:hypothetical protein
VDMASGRRGRGLAYLDLMTVCIECPVHVLEDSLSLGISGVSIIRRIPFLRRITNSPDSCVSRKNL